MSDTLVVASVDETLTVADVRSTVRLSPNTDDTLDISVTGLTATLTPDGNTVLVSASAPTELVLSAAGASTIEVSGGRGAQGPAGPGGPEGGTLLVIAGQTLSGHRVVRPQDDGTVIYATNVDLADAGRALWLTLGAALVDDEVTVRSFGVVDEPSWSWIDAPVYLDVDGLLTQTVPVSPAAFLVQVGSPDGPTSLFYDPRMPIAL